MNEALSIAKRIAVVSGRAISAAQSGDNEILKEQALEIQALSAELLSASEIPQKRSKIQKVNDGIYCIPGDSSQQMKDAKDFLRRRGIKSPKEGVPQQVEGKVGVFFRQMGKIAIVFISGEKFNFLNYKST